MKIKTIEASNAYKAIKKKMKMTLLSDDTLILVWRNLKALRPISDEYDKDVEDARKSLEDEKYNEMLNRLQNAMERENQIKEGNHVMTTEEKKDVEEINKWFMEFNMRGKKFFDDIDHKEVEVEIHKVPEGEILKALKDNENTFDVMETLEWMLE